MPNLYKCSILDITDPDGTSCFVVECSAMAAAIRMQRWCQEREPDRAAEIAFMWVTTADLGETVHHRIGVIDPADIPCTVFSSLPSSENRVMECEQREVSM